MTKKSKTLNDVFYNVSPKIHVLLQLFELYTEKELISEVKTQIPKDKKNRTTKKTTTTTQQCLCKRNRTTNTTHEKINKQ